MLVLSPRRQSDPFHSRGAGNYVGHYHKNVYTETVQIAYWRRDYEARTDNFGKSEEIT